MAEFAHVTGLVLAAGAGARAGGPKALRRDAEGTPWLHRATAALRDGGCAEVVVVLGAAAEDARALVPEGARIVVAADWGTGLSASLRTGLAASDGSPSAAALVTLVDLPGLPSQVVERVLAEGGEGPGALARAVFDGRPGHPVLLGRDHWAAIAANASGDRGAGSYLRARATIEIECRDVWDGADVDL